MNDLASAVNADAVLFHEAQPLPSRHGGQFLALLAASVVTGVVFWRGESAWAAVALGGLAGGLLRCWQRARPRRLVRTTLTSSSLRLSAEPQGPARLIAVDAIEDCWARDLEQEDFGTQRRAVHAVYVARPGRGIEVLLSDGETLVVSTRFPEILAGLILARRGKVGSGTGTRRAAVPTIPPRRVERFPTPGGARGPSGGREGAVPWLRN